MKKSQLYAYLVLAILQLNFTLPSYAKIPTALESEFALAILSISDQDYGKSIQILDKLIESSPETLEFLELKASVFKKNNDPKKTAEVYKEIIKVQNQAKKPAEEIAPYYFELGLIYFEEKNYPEAINNFKYSVKSKALSGVSFFYVGMTYFSIENFFTAERAFRKVIKSDQKTLIPIAHFYLGQIYFKRKNTSLALEEMSQAKNLADEIIADSNETDSSKKVATQISEAAEKILEPINRARFFSSVGLRGEYDSNILSLPDSTIENTSTGISSYKSNFQAGIGYISPPLSFIQVIPSYRFATNFNSNEDARQYEYASNTFSLFFNRKPLDPLTYGLKIIGVYTFENKGTLVKRFDYEPYSLDGEFGPYIKIPLTSFLDLGLEYNLAIIRYKTTTDDFDGRNGRNATTHKPQFSFLLKTDSNYLNPSLTSQYRFTIAKGYQYTTRAYAFNLDNDFNILAKLKVSLGLNYSYTQYFKRLPDRRGDRLYGASLSINYNILSSLSVSTGARWTKNQSNLDSQYSYDKMLYFLGINYQIF